MSDKIYLFFPYKTVSGVPILFSRIVEHFSKYKKVTIIDLVLASRWFTKWKVMPWVSKNRTKGEEFLCVCYVAVIRINESHYLNKMKTTLQIQNLI